MVWDARPTSGGPMPVVAHATPGGPIQGHPHVALPVVAYATPGGPIQGHPHGALPVVACATPGGRVAYATPGVRNPHLGPVGGVV